MKKIILLPNRDKDPGFTLSLRVLKVLQSFCTKVYTEKENAELVSLGAIPYMENDFPADAELLLVLGGDGTMLHAATAAAQHGIPLMGINIGRLGYLATVEPAEIEDLRSLADNTYIEQSRMLLDVVLQGSDGKKVFLGRALNDVFIDGGGHLADLRLFEKQSSLDYRANGLIVATPTGSTAYSLSAGGPVMDENMSAICVTPICPRSFFSRSLLFPEDALLRIVNLEARADTARVSIDGFLEVPLSRGDEIIVRRSALSVRILTLKPRRLLEVLSTKMNTQHF